MCIAINQSIKIGNGHAVIYYNLLSCNLYAHSSFNNRLFTFNSLLTIKEYTHFVEMYVTSKRRRGRPQRVYIHLLRLSNRVDLGILAFLSV